MTKEEKIKEVMELVYKYGHTIIALDYAKTTSDISSAMKVCDKADEEIESKLRELIQ